jgi:saccharopine dehydrogenase-like NADP-dependent oxidoreductase
MKKIVAVIGSNGAIGNSISENLLKDDLVDCIYKFSRKINDKDTDKVKNIVIDIEDEDSIKQAGQ